MDLYYISRAYTLTLALNELYSRTSINEVLIADVTIWRAVFSVTVFFFN